MFIIKHCSSAREYNNITYILVYSADAVTFYVGTHTRKIISRARGVVQESVNNHVRFALFFIVTIIIIVIVIIIQFANNSERCESNSNIDRLKTYIHALCIYPLAFTKKKH